MVDKKTIATAHLKFLGARGYRVGPRILDFGCGDGETVSHLLDLGYDAHGVEVQNQWTRFGLDIPGRLHVANKDKYRLPFDDNSFDTIISDQVFEHVGNLDVVFAEILRVLKPDGVSVHRFPGPGGLVESHTKLPLTALCLSPTYITLCALTGIRVPEQSGQTWRQVRDFNLWLMSLNYYPTKPKIRQAAARCGGIAEFWEKQEAFERSFGRASKYLKLAAKVGADKIAAAAISPFLQRYMILRHNVTSTRQDIQAKQPSVVQQSQQPQYQDAL